MTISINGIAHVQLTVRHPEACLPFWEKLCEFMGMSPLIQGDNVVYYIGGRTGVLVRGAPEDKKDVEFDQDTSGLHHVCFRARSREDVDQISQFAENELSAHMIHAAEGGAHFAPGYYSVLFEDPDGIRVEVNYVPGKGHFGDKGRLGPDGPGPANRYGDDAVAGSRGGWSRSGSVE